MILILTLIAINLFTKFFLRVLPIIDDPEFTFERMKTKSAAAANLVSWVVNIIRFNSIYKRVKPLMDSLGEFVVVCCGVLWCGVMWCGVVWCDVM